MIEVVRETSQVMLDLFQSAAYVPLDLGRVTSQRSLYGEDLGFTCKKITITCNGYTPRSGMPPTYE